MDRIEELIRLAEENERLCSDSIKNLGLGIGLDDFQLLARKGAATTSRNEPTCDKCYIHRLTYRGYKFKTLTTSPLKP